MVHFDLTFTNEYFNQTRFLQINFFKLDSFWNFFGLQLLLWCLIHCQTPCSGLIDFLINFILLLKNFKSLEIIFKYIPPLFRFISVSRCSPRFPLLLSDTIKRRLSTNYWDLRWLWDIICREGPQSNLIKGNIQRLFEWVWRKLLVVLFLFLASGGRFSPAIGLSTFFFVLYWQTLVENKALVYVFLGDVDDIDLVDAQLTVFDKYRFTIWVVRCPGYYLIPSWLRCLAILVSTSTGSRRLS